MDHKYEEALERARKGMPIDDVFPELKESKDERIRTRLIALVEAFGQGEYKDEMLAYLERQKEQKPAKDTALQEAFINSKIDYTLEEKCDASDYAEIILPTSVIYGENKEEYKLHKIIEAAFIAGQKKEQNPEWSEEDEEALRELLNILSRRELDISDDSEWLSFKLKNWLKSLRPQPHWKPSEEQIDCLQEAIEEAESERLYSLQEKLIDLMESLKKL